MGGKRRVNEEKNVTVGGAKNSSGQQVGGARAGGCVGNHKIAVSLLGPASHVEFKTDLALRAIHACDPQAAGAYTHSRASASTCQHICVAACVLRRLPQAVRCRACQTAGA